MTQDQMALDQLERRKELLPKFCPSWCTNAHAQALDEGCDLESASAHLGPDVAYYLPEVRNVTAGRVNRPSGGAWSARLVAGTPGPSEAALVELEVQANDHQGSVSLFITTGEARTLAAQLQQQADMHDLHGLVR